jgi:Lon-like ATP-dependent protease
MADKEEDGKTQGETLKPMDEWVRDQPFLTTAEIEIPPRLVDQVIGQDPAVEVIKKAAAQKRHVMLIGEPGTGKSMLAKAMAEVLPREELQDILVFNNIDDNNNPRVRTVPSGKGKEIVAAHKLEALKKKNERNQLLMMILTFVVIVAAVLAIRPDGHGNITVDPMTLFFGIIAAAMIFMAFRWTGQKQENAFVPKLLISHTPDDKPPFVDATGSHAGALLGDVRHDPFQSGGLETPSHERVEAGAIHRAHKGVLFIDEINILKLESQQSLLTALQEKEFAIVGQSERSSGAMVRTEAVPCDFVLVAAGNLDAVEGMHPALRSRIRGYGYEIYMKNSMEDTADNREKLIRFVAQEVAKDKKIPHFNKTAITSLLHEAQRRAGTRGHLTLRLRELGGLIRVAGDIAREKGAPLATSEHVVAAKKIARTLEQQVADQLVEKKKEYKNYLIEGAEVGRVNGLGVLGGESGVSEHAGVVLPIVAEMTPARSRSQGDIIATGKLGEIAKEAVQNVSAIIKKYTGDDISNHDVHIQFIGTYEGVEGDSASISVATAVISAMEDVEVSQKVAMTGSLSVRGQVLPVGAVTAKCEAAAEAGMTKVLIPLANARDVLIDDKYKNKIEIIFVDDIIDVLQNALAAGPKRDRLIQKLSAINPRLAMSVARPPPTGVPAPQG